MAAVVADEAVERALVEGRSRSRATPVCFVGSSAGSVGSSRSATQAVRTIESAYLVARGSSGKRGEDEPARIVAIPGGQLGDRLLGDVRAVLDADAAVLEVVQQAVLLERRRVLPEDQRIRVVRPGRRRVRVVLEVLGKLRSAARDPAPAPRRSAPRRRRRSRRRSGCRRRRPWRGRFRRRSPPGRAPRRRPRSRRAAFSPPALRGSLEERTFGAWTFRGGAGVLGLSATAGECSSGC